VPIFIVSHDQPVPINNDAEITFVTRGIETAHREAKTKAGDKIYGYSVGQILHNNT
jgi:hypothetical protein